MTLLKRRRAVNNPSQLNRRQDDSSSSALSSTTLKNGLISVTTLGRVGYAGHVLIGNPPQRISVLFDTGSDLALVISDQCKGQECADLVQFSCLKSTTCIELGEDMTKSAGGKVAIATGDNATSSNSSSGVPQLEGQVGGNSTSHSINSRSSDSKVQQPAGPSVVKIEEGPWSLDPKDNDMHHQDAEPAPSMTRGRVSAVAGVNLSTGVGSGADANFYNQTYVDGSWGAGTFVQDRIQIDTTPPGQVFINNNSVVENNQAIRSPHSDIKVPSPSSGKSFSPSSSSSSTGHGAAVTFLDVVEDNLGLVQGYDGQISGLLGLTRASPTGRKTFLQELVEQGSLAQPIISMHLEWEGGSFLLGGIDHSQYVGELIYSPVTDPVSWQISLQGLGTRSRNRTASAAIDVGKGGKGQVGEAIGARVGPGIGKQQISGHTYDSNNAEIRMLPQQSVFQDASLVLDSGTSSILIPTAASEAIHAELFGTWDPIHRAWFLPCEGPDLIWWISSGHGIVQPHESLVYKLEDGRCQSLIFEDQDADYWILGDTWLRGLYLVYDMEGSGRIGIANAIGSEGSKASKDECQTDDRVRILTVKENGF
ncbi:1,3-beta-glucanosyltransferase [Mortierella claussenii]|nr:1,3-beta-glucanosyltransferase [Mortierella claussenii]